MGREIIRDLSIQREGFQWYCIYADLSGPWQVAIDGFRWVLAISDGDLLLIYDNYPPTQQKHETIVQAPRDIYIFVFGIPHTLCADNEINYDIFQVYVKG